MFRGLSHCSTSPPSHRRIFTISSTQDFPYKEPPLRIWVIQTGGTQLLSPTIQPLHKRQDTTQITFTLKEMSTELNNYQPHTRGIRHLANTPTITSTLRAIPTQPPQSPLTRGITTQIPLTRGISQSKECLQLLVVSTTTNQFSH